MARPSQFPSPTPSTAQQSASAALSDGPGRLQWLQQLKAGDKVIVCLGQHSRQERQVDSTSPTLITIGKRKRINFRRADGKIAGKRPMAHLFRIEMPT